MESAFSPTLHGDAMPRSGSDPEQPSFAPTPGGDVAADLARLMARDLVFVMRFLGESQHRLQGHFQEFILAELARAGVSRASHPLIGGFAETHALMMRDFVFAGVSLSRQFRIDEIERLLGDTTSLLRVDIWDQLRRHVEMAEEQFRGQLPRFAGELDRYLPPAPGEGDGDD
jgi:hypothetical protein